MDDFSAFFTDYLIEALTPLEKKRKRILTGKFTILITMSLLIALNLFMYHFRASWYPVKLPFWSLFVSIPSILLLSEFIYRQFFSGSGKLSDDFKTLILAKMLDYLGPNFSFFPEEHIPYKHFKQSHLFLIKPDHYVGDDMVTGNIGGADIQFSELDVGYQTSNEKEEKQWHFLTGSDQAMDAFIDAYPFPEASQKVYAGSNTVAIADTSSAVRFFYDMNDPKKVSRLIEHIANLMPQAPPEKARTKRELDKDKTSK